MFYLSKYSRVCWVMAVIIFSLTSAHADVPSNLCPADSCEYLVRNYAGNYPDNRERSDGHWQCYDQVSKTSVAWTKLLEKAIAKVRELPAEDQDTFAVALLSMAGEDTPIVHLDDETRAAVREGLAQAERGEFVADEVVAEADRRHRPDEVIE
jgi:predicted transcriptional regulator